MTTTRTRRLAIAAATTVASSALATFSAAPAQADPVWVANDHVSTPGLVPDQAEIAVSPQGVAVAVWRQTDGSHQRVAMSVRYPGQSFGVPMLVSAKGASAQGPHVAINDRGRAVISWIRETSDGWRLQVRHFGKGGTLGKTVNVSTTDESVDTFTALDVAPDGSAMVAWPRAKGDTYALKLTRVAPTSEKRTWTLAGTTNDVQLDTNRTGLTSVVWIQPAWDLQYAVRSRRLQKGKLTSAQTLHTGPVLDLDIALNDAGEAIASYRRKEGDLYRVVAHAASGGGAFGPGQVLSPAGVGTHDVRVGIAADGTQVAAWPVATGMQARVRVDGTWSPLAPLAGSGAPTGASVAMNDAGDIAIHWTDADSVRTYWMAGDDPGFVPAEPYEGWGVMPMASVGLDGQGNAITLHGIELGGELNQLFGKVLDTVGPQTRIVELNDRVSTATFPVRWLATDRYSGIDSVDVLRRTADWNGAFGGSSLWSVDNSSGEDTNDGVPGRTYCFAATGTDTAGNVGGLSSWHCATTPVDDRTATSTGFTDKDAQGYYEATYRRATEKGSKLVLQGARARRIGLLVAKGPGNGEVKVFFGGKSLGTWSLKASKDRQKVKILVADLGSVKTGNLVVKVVSDGKPVRIDGIHIAK